MIVTATKEVQTDTTLSEMEHVETMFGHAMKSIKTLQDVISKRVQKDQSK